MGQADVMFGAGHHPGVHHGCGKHAVGRQTQRKVKGQPSRSLGGEQGAWKHPGQDHRGGPQAAHGPAGLEFGEKLGLDHVGCDHQPGRDRQRWGKTETHRPHQQHQQADGMKAPGQPKQAACVHIAQAAGHQSG